MMTTKFLLFALVALVCTMAPVLANEDVQLRGRGDDAESLAHGRTLYRKGCFVEYPSGAYCKYIDSQDCCGGCPNGYYLYFLFWKVCN